MPGCRVSHCCSLLHASWVQQHSSTGCICLKPSMLSHSTRPQAAASSPAFTVARPLGPRIWNCSCTCSRPSLSLYTLQPLGLAGWVGSAAAVVDTCNTFC